MFDLIDNYDNRLLQWDQRQSWSAMDLPRSQNMASFFRLSISLNDFFFGPSLPAPQIQPELGTCTSDVDLYGVLIFALPWSNEVYLHRFK